MGKLDPSKAMETSLDLTDEDGERLPQRRTARRQRQPNAFTNFTCVSRNPRELTREPMTENRKKYISKSLTQRYGETSGCSECTPEHRESFDCVVQFQAGQHIHQAAGTKRGAENHPMFFVSKESSCDSPSGASDPVAVAC